MKNRKLLAHTVMYTLMLSITHGACAMDNALISAQETNFLTKKQFRIGNILCIPDGSNLQEEHTVACFEVNRKENQSDSVTIKLKNNASAPYLLHKKHLEEIEIKFSKNQKVNSISFSIVPDSTLQLQNDYYIVTRKTFTEFTNYNSIANIHDALSDEETDESSHSQNADETDSSSAEKEEPQENPQPDTVQTLIDIPKLNLDDTQAPKGDIIDKTINNTEEKPVTTATTFSSDKTKFFIGSASFVVATLAFLYHCYPELFSSESLSSVLQKFSFNKSAQ